jgi:integrase/recombinase XerD
MPLMEAVEAFLGDLTRAGRSPATCRAYRGDLSALGALHPGSVNTVALDTVRQALDTSAHLAPATRARRQAAMASFFTWAVRQGITDVDPVLRLSPVHVEPALPRGIPADQVQAILAAIPRARLRDRVLFGLIASTGLRAGEALRIHIEDVDLTRAD